MFLMVCLRIPSLFGFSIDFSCMAPLTITMIVVTGLTFHPKCLISSTKGSYFMCFFLQVGLLVSTMAVRDLILLGG